MGHHRKLAWIGLIALVALWLWACDVILPTDTPASTPQSTRVATPAATVTPAGSPTPEPAPTPITTSTAVVLSLGVAEIQADIPRYDRDDWRHWLDVDRDCQDARQEALVAESLSPVAFETEDDCRVESGSWVGPYTGTTVTDPSTLDIDHMVPLANAHRSGGWEWDKERKAEYANSLDYDDHLIATTRSANRAKGSNGPEDWRPPDESYWCDYAIDWVTIKGEWGLTATQREAQALREMLELCPEETVLETHATEDLPVPPPPDSTPPPAPTVPSGRVIYESCEDAESAGELRIQGSSGSGRGFPEAVVPGARDGDGDGVVCER